MKSIDLVGKEFGQGVVIKYSHQTTRGKNRIRAVRMWELLCSCGKTYYGSTEALRCGDLSSCGCIKYKFHSVYSPKTIGRWWKTLVYEAHRRNHILTITQEEALSLLSKQNYKCSLSQLPIQIEDGTASLDRISNDNGYVIDNIQWLNRKVNYMKNSLSQEEFISLCGLISENMNPTHSV